MLKHTPRAAVHGTQAGLGLSRQPSVGDGGETFSACRSHLLTAHPGHRRAVVGFCTPRARGFLLLAGRCRLCAGIGGVSGC